MLILSFSLKTNQNTLLSFLLPSLNLAFLKGKIRGSGQKNSLAELSSHIIDNYWPCRNKKGKAEKSCSILTALLLLCCLHNTVLDHCLLEKLSCGMVRSENTKMDMGSMYRQRRSETRFGKKSGKRTIKITDVAQDAEKCGQKVILNTPWDVGKERRKIRHYCGALFSYL